MQFKSGDVYHYHGVPVSVHENLIGAKSLGQHFVQHVSGKFEHTKK